MHDSRTPFELLLVGGDQADRVRFGVLLSQATGALPQTHLASGLPAPEAAGQAVILLEAAADPGFAGLRAFTHAGGLSPVIVFSPWHDAALEEQAMAAGAFDCVSTDRLDARPLLRAARWAASDARCAAARRRVEDAAGRERLESHLRQAQKMDALGRLAGGVAHDFNNLLTAIIGFSDMLLDQMADHDPRFRDAQEIRKAAGRGTDLTRQLLAFSRKQVVLAPAPLDLSGIVTAFEPMLRRLIGEHIRLAIDATPALPRVKADAGQIEQVVMNLVVNARDAMPGGGRVTIETFAVEVDEVRARQHAGASPGLHVGLAVTDNGCGMSDDVQAHLFEPFFTTKGHSQGTGLGLATVYGIVSRFGGFIDVRSRPRRGTRIEICFHAVAGGAAGIGDTEGGRLQAPGGRETVLVVEDDQTVREMITELLGRGGYHVLDAASGEAAIDVASRFQGEIHLLLTDVVMPEMSGPALMARLSPARPGMRVLYVSGYAEHASVLSDELQPDTDFLQKPFPPGTLMHRVRRALDSGR
jgi:signal transduction histidine kinase